MTVRQNTFLLISAVATLVLSACASQPVDLADRDVSGLYDGVWVASVAGPRAREAILPGNWVQQCGWEPFEVDFVVNDGMLQLGDREERTPVSADGRFVLTIDLDNEARMSSGVLPADNTFRLMFKGKLIGDSPRGQYMQFIPAISASGCSARIDIRRYIREDDSSYEI